MSYPVALTLNKLSSVSVMKKQRSWDWHDFWTSFKLFLRQMSDLNNLPRRQCLCQQTLKLLIFLLAGAQFQAFEFFPVPDLFCTSAAFVRLQGPTYDLTFGEHRGYRNGQSLTIKERPDSWVQEFLPRSDCLGPLDMCQHCLLQLLLHFTSATQGHLVLIKPFVPTALLHYISHPNTIGNPVFIL